MDTNSRTLLDPQKASLFDMPPDLMGIILALSLSRIVQVQIRQAQTPSRKPAMRNQNPVWHHIGRHNRTKKLQRTNQMRPGVPLSVFPKDLPCQLLIGKDFYRTYGRDYVKVINTVSGARFFFNARLDTLFFDSRDAIRCWNETVESLTSEVLEPRTFKWMSGNNTRDLKVKSLAVRYSNAMTEKPGGFDSTLRLLADLGTVGRLIMIRDRPKYARRLARVISGQVQQAWDDMNARSKITGGFCWSNPKIQWMTWKELKAGHV